MKLISKKNSMLVLLSWIIYAVLYYLLAAFSGWISGMAFAFYLQNTDPQGLGVIKFFTNFTSLLDYLISFISFYISISFFYLKMKSNNTE